MSQPIATYHCTEAALLDVVLERLSARLALPEGRVFVDGVRAAQPAQALAAGARVDVYSAREARPSVRVLARQGGLAFVEKPAGVPTEPERRGSTHSVVAQFAEQAGCAVADVHALSRLDLGVSGVVLLGLDAQARQRVQALREEGRLQRRYVALAAQSPVPPAGRWNDFIQRPSASARRSAGTTGEVAETHFYVAGTAPAPRTECVLALTPVTGRTHQLRIHASAHGAALLGDRTYGGPGRLHLASGDVHGLDRVYLHAAWVRLGDAEPVACEAPAEFASIWALLGGSADALTRAVAESLEK